MDLTSTNDLLIALSGSVMQIGYFVAGLLSALIAVVSWRA
jgi:hypothetical protein